MSRESWPIIVGGCHRSGTSLIRRILDAHSHIYCGPEVKFFRDFYSDYPGFDPAQQIRFATSARTICPEEELLQILGRAYVTLLENAAARAGKVRWADKNPENVLYLDQWQELLGDNWLMVQVVRNPLDTLASIKEISFPLAVPPEFEERIYFYRNYTTAGLEFGEKYPERYYRLVYERLVQSPEQSVAELMSWLGEKFESRQMRFNEVPHHLGIEDPKVVGTSEVHRDSLDRWRTILTDDEAATIWRETSDLWRQIDPESQYLAPPTAVPS